MEISNTNTRCTEQPVVHDVLVTKYARGDETTLATVPQIRSAIRSRVAKGLAVVEKDPEFWAPIFTEAQEVFIPAGRIPSACGTSVKASLINCKVQPVGDAFSQYDHHGVPGIFKALTEAGLTMKVGCGVGYNFSGIRPWDAKVSSTQSKSSGPVSYMPMFDVLCGNLASIGNRRGAQMGVLDVTHPDIVQFVSAKSTGGLKNFNISVNMSDAFVEAVRRGDKEFDLFHEAEPSDALQAQGAYQRPDGMWVYRRVDPVELNDLIIKNTYNAAEPGVLFGDRINYYNNLYYAEYINATNPCGEQPLPPYGSCCLGSINLVALVRDPFSDQPRLDWSLMEQVVAVAVRMLDNVLDVTMYPLEQQRVESMTKRRIGLGFTGLGTALVMMGLPYNSDEGYAFQAEVARRLCHAAYRASIELAKEKGAFPLFDAEKYLAGQFVSRLPDDIKRDIAAYGIRNSHLTSIAPTGTISLAFGDNCSNGIEPPFSWYYDRKVRQPDGSNRWYKVVDPAFALYRHNQQISPTLPDGSDNPAYYTDVDLPPQFVNALQMTAIEHARSLAVVQPYIDSAISKTVNVPVDYPFEQFKGLYLWAWENGLKGLATYRPNDVTGSVLSVEGQGAVPAITSLAEDPDRKITLTSMEMSALTARKWPKRPIDPAGFDGRAYLVDHPEQPFSVFISHKENGARLAFEAWVNGAEVPRLLPAVAKTLASDMRCLDRQWIQLKAEAISLTESTPFDMTWVDGHTVHMPSASAALAKLISHRCRELEGDGAEPAAVSMVDALICRREPKGQGMAWYWDVKNPRTGDDFVLFIKDVTMPDGTERPLSFWAAGKYPKELDALLKSLSIDAHIIDLAWVADKLVSLLDFPEALGDALMKVPGDVKSAHYPSTVAYLAAVILYRYRQMGLLGEDHTPVNDAGLFTLVQAKDLGEPASSARTSHEPCPDCSHYTLTRVAGCKRCTHCGFVGECG